MKKKIAITLVIVLLVTFSFLLGKWHTVVGYYGEMIGDDEGLRGNSFDVPSIPTQEELQELRARAVAAAMQDWEQKSASIFPKRGDSDGRLKNRISYYYRYDRDTGLRYLSQLRTGLMQRISENASNKAYDSWIRYKLEKEGIPEWGLKDKIPPLDVLSDYMSGKKPMTLVDKLPFKISEKIYLRRAEKKYLGDHFTRVELVFEDSHEVVGIHKVTGEARRMLRDSVGPFNVHPHNAEGMPIYFARFEQHPETMIFRVGDVLIRVMVGEQIIAQLRKDPPSKDDKKPLLDKTK